MYEVVEIIKAVLVAAMIFLVGKLIYLELTSRKKKREAAKQKAAEPAPTVVKPVEEPEKESVIVRYQNPKVAALRGAVRQGLTINMMMLDAQKQMADIAAMHRTDTTTRRDPQSDPNYVKAEWLVDGNWVPDDEYRRYR